MKRLAGLAGVLALTACGGERDAALQRDPGSTLDPKGEGAHVVSQEMWVQFAVSAAGLALVVVLLIWIVVRGLRRSPPAPEGVGTSWVVLGGLVLPAVVLTALFGVSVRSLAALDKSGPYAATVEVVGHRWWWEVRYLGTPITTANEIVIPVDRPVHLRLRSRDVIHSLWVPQLQKKLDLLPSEWTYTWLESDSPGVYRGVCAEFCGLQHARMHFLVRALPAARWRLWLETAAEPAPPPATPRAKRGEKVFLSSSCAYCHSIRGTPAAGWVGPDLTHFASRHAFAGAMLPNRRGYLAGWISDPQHQKPGALMPRTPLGGADLQALLDYLESLK
jgi:cytochrome c oxidase subunit II